LSLLNAMARNISDFLKVTDFTRQL
jgi:hypothetical protein